MSEFPLLDRIPEEKRPTAINLLDCWQRLFHDQHKLDVTVAIRKKRYRVIGEGTSEVIIDAPSYQEEEEIEIQKEISRAPSHQERVS